MSQGTFNFSRWREATIISNVKIAVVDHDPMVRDFIVNVMMYSVNRDILAFGSAGDLKRYITTNGAPDIILSEAHLPDAPDFNLLRMIKASYPSTCFIALSADPAAESTAAALGADAFLAKPFTLKDLFSIVERFVVNAPGP